MPVSIECSHAGCTNAASWRPTIKVWAKGCPKAPDTFIRGEIGIAVCDMHKETVHLDNFLSSEIWNAITAALRSTGKADPDPSTAELDFIPLWASDFNSDGSLKTANG